MKRFKVPAIVATGQLSGIDVKIVNAVTALQGKPIESGKLKGKIAHGVHSVYSGIWNNVVTLSGGKEQAVATFDRLVASGVLYAKPSKGGFSYATTPFPVSAKTSTADTFFK